MQTPEVLAIRLRKAAAELLREAVRTSWDLFKVVIPISIAVRLLELAGVVGFLGTVLGPVMGLVGLPGSMGLVWATALVVNLYAAIVVFVAVAPAADLTVAQVTVLTTMMLIAHGLPVELRIAQKAGPRLRFMAALRICGALAVGWGLHHVYRLGGFLQGASVLRLRLEQSDPSWWGWLRGQAGTLAMIFAILLGLLVLIRLLKWLRIEALLQRLLGPVLRALGMSRAAAPITIVGMTLGLTYGGGLIIQEARSGRLSPRDVLGSLALMGLTHSLIEDTLLMTALGGHHSGILWARLAFSLLAVFALSQCLRRISEKTFRRFLFRTLPADA